MEIVKADDRSVLLVETKRFKANKKLIDRFVLQFQNLQIGLRVSDFANDVIELSRPRATPNVSSSKSGLLIAQEKPPSGSFSKKFNIAHLIRTVNAVFAVFGELFEQLPAESSFTGGRSCAYYVKPWTEKLLVVKIVKAGESISIVFQRVDVSFEVVSEIIRKV